MFINFFDKQKAILFRFGETERVVVMDKKDYKAVCEFAKTPKIAFADVINFMNLYGIKYRYADRAFACKTIKLQSAT